jgi:cytoplasmic iron level regulating protein YaaA (DUF328/UPF0246 family)
VGPARGKLSAYFQDDVSAFLQAELFASAGRSGRSQEVRRTVVNVASDEYAAVVDRTALRVAGVRFVKPVFLDDGKQIAVFAKRARGLLVRWMAQQRVEEVPGDSDYADVAEMLQRFDLEGYHYESTSTNPKNGELELRFVRVKPAPGTSKTKTNTSTVIRSLSSCG